jgi:Uma2 family endonuclease
MAAAAITKRYTPEEYLCLERKAEFKSEYCNGDITARSGASRAHNLVTGNIYAEVRNDFKDRPCEVYACNMRVRTSPTGLYTYPDVVAVCGEPLFLDDEFDTLLNPTLIVEVLSPSTETYDRGRKFDQYKAIASLREYIIVSQDEVLVERFVKRGNQWERTTYRDTGETLRLESIHCDVSLLELYAKVRLANGEIVGLDPL